MVRQKKQPQSTSRRECIFCGSRAGSREHILPDWLKMLFPRSADSRHMFAFMEPGDTHDAPKITQYVKPGHSGSVKVRVVCEGCNNGWMAGLENRAKPVLKQLIRGESCRLGPEEQNILATWAAKTAMTAECKRTRPDGTTRQEREYLKQKLRPPPHWLVWLAGYDGASWKELTVFQSRGNLRMPAVGLPGPKVNYVQATTFGMGRVVFRTIGTTFSDSAAIIAGIGDDGFIRLHPNLPSSVIWPPAATLNDRQIGAAANVLNRIFNNSLNPLAGWAFTP